MEGRCRKHPEHKQSKGVCPYCLIERLYQLSSSSSSATTIASAATSSLGSNLHSVDASPSTKTKSQKLKKSRSLTAAIGKQMVEDKANDKEGKRKKRKNGSFWSKLMTGSERKKGEGSMLHSKTLKEKSAAKWIIF